LSESRLVSFTRQTNLVNVVIIDKKNWSKPKNQVELGKGKIQKRLFKKHGPIHHLLLIRQ